MGEKKGTRVAEVFSVVPFGQIVAASQHPNYSLSQKSTSGIEPGSKGPFFV
jgi:hypothetical protein